MPSLLLLTITLLRARINSAVMRVGRLSTDPVSVMLAHAGLSHCIAITMTSRMDDHSLQSSPVNLGRQRDETVDAHLIDASFVRRSTPPALISDGSRLPSLCDQLTRQSKLETRPILDDDDGSDVYAQR
ncbi:hypothetical protein BDZ90DRAFT_146276 [Jaminaea rosea]|uniref:Secreted protein n=1 Tax=Jaminaea rosea TaxID=1569628 RepID=A0A316UYX6_9BASI|nr:hypothetical protein BDZ90DRAFT_146276 [Jaminaea rosea]PWN28355.1 hypothetical protein BDZ90DRAFT_146276 [Jaminaea rosea]